MEDWKLSNGKYMFLVEVNPAILVVAEVGLIIVVADGPATCVQVPVPLTGTVAVKVADAGLTQAVLLGPALATDGAAAKFISISSCEELLQGAPVAIVHLKVYTPFAVAVAPEVGLFCIGKLLTVPGPFTTVHVPVPTNAVLAFKLAIVSPQTAVSFPASAVVGNAVTSTVTESLCVQPLFPCTIVYIIFSSCNWIYSYILSGSSTRSPQISICKTIGC
jgi:hypothetical protein